MSFVSHLSISRFRGVYIAIDHVGSYLPFVFASIIVESTQSKVQSVESLLLDFAIKKTSSR